MGIARCGRVMGVQCSWSVVMLECCDVGMWCSWSVVMLECGDVGVWYLLWSFRSSCAGISIGARVVK